MQEESECIACLDPIKTGHPSFTDPCKCTPHSGQTINHYRCLVKEIITNADNKCKICGLRYEDPRIIREFQKDKNGKFNGQVFIKFMTQSNKRPWMVMDLNKAYYAQRIKAEMQEHRDESRLSYHMMCDRYNVKPRVMYRPMYENEERQFRVNRNDWPLNTWELKHLWETYRDMYRRDPLILLEGLGVDRKWRNDIMRRAPFPNGLTFEQFERQYNRNPIAENLPFKKFVGSIIIDIIFGENKQWLKLQEKIEAEQRKQDQIRIRINTAADQHQEAVILESLARSQDRIKELEARMAKIQQQTYKNRWTLTGKPVTSFPSISSLASSTPSMIDAFEAMGYVPPEDEEDEEDESDEE